MPTTRVYGPTATEVTQPGAGRPSRTTVSSKTTSPPSFRAPVTAPGSLASTSTSTTAAPSLQAGTIGSPPSKQGIVRRNISTTTSTTTAPSDTTICERATTTRT